jgi:hypothetical protein
MISQIFLSKSVCSDDIPLPRQKLFYSARKSAILMLQSMAFFKAGSELKRRRYGAFYAPPRYTGGMAA